MASVYFRPVTAVVRLEAVWVVRIGYARSAFQLMKRFLKLIKLSPEKKYEPSTASQGGYDASLIHLSIENSLDNEDVLGDFPDW